MVFDAPTESAVLFKYSMTELTLTAIFEELKKAATLDMWLNSRAPILKARLSKKFAKTSAKQSS